MPENTFDGTQNIGTGDGSMMSVNNPLSET